MPGIKAERGGVKSPGRVTVGVTAVKVQASLLSTRSWMAKNKGPGVIYFGDSAVTATTDYIDIAVGDTLVLDESADDIWMISTLAGTVVPFVREAAP